MRCKTIIILRWRLSGRIESFSNLGKLYDKYENDELGVSRSTLDRKNLFDGYKNDTVEINKSYLNKI